MSTQYTPTADELVAMHREFKQAWKAHDYAAIIAKAKTLPVEVLVENPLLCMWYDNAVTRMYPNEMRDTLASDAVNFFSYFMGN